MLNYEPASGCLISSPPQVEEWVKAGLGPLEGYLSHEKQPTPLGPPQGPRHRPTVESLGGAVNYERGTPVRPTVGNTARRTTLLPVP